MLAIVAALYVAGGVLPLLGLVLGVWRGRREYRRLAEKLHFIDRIVTRTGRDPTPEDIAYWLDTYSMELPEAPHQAQWMYAPEIAQKAIWAQLRQPAYLAGVGIILGSAGSLLSLTL